MCDPNPCRNDGVCENGALSAICSCPFPFYGTECELEENFPDFCDPNPCQNDGVCENGALSAICSCPFPFYGTECELEENFPDFCDPNPCQNDGVCENGALSAICSCPFPFYGTECELEENFPDFCDPNPCQNGGVCENGALSAICSCPFPLYGTECELEELPPTPPNCPAGMVRAPQSDNDIALGQVRCLGYDNQFALRTQARASCRRAFGNDAELLVVDSVDIWHIAGNRILQLQAGAGGGNRGARARTAGIQIAAVEGFENAGWESSRYWGYDLDGDLTPDFGYEWHTASGYFWREGFPDEGATSFDPSRPREVILDFDQLERSGVDPPGWFGFTDFLVSGAGNFRNLCQVALPYLPYFAETPEVE
uniref:EGF-like domain-containing protein n=1 Tax=Chromera velia CCMP2878 TaxID=1169474 RepID=A0A0G4I3K3_9ALVE|eukprot:Cvel_10692.t1-p1 / transcript=Cvel_10692.t1 / gene=Cvel_10692 / organism=Chromera_velia_CCMP2878 / gene_product=Fibropellin-1, putative / transcript_product=Fibropellin-1, putative / location=Cvel_scaffold650:22784-24127(+) / protein_length=368 / sequence_SO=supercontig / SO=protein_coding / is_pseudo=false